MFQSMNKCFSVGHWRDRMKPRLLVLLLVVTIFLMLTLVDARKGGLRIRKPKPVHISKPKPVHIKKPKPVHIKKPKPIKVNKKVKRFFAVKHTGHHKKKHTTTSVIPYITPTLTTFTSYPMIPTPVLLTITDRNFNYFYGYAATVNGAQYYNSPNYMVAGPKNCGCADSHPIIVTTVPGDIGI